jgi:hypothetical protein
MITCELKSLKLMDRELREACNECGAQIVREILVEVRDRAKASMKPGHGKPSKPGRPPNVQTGHLRAGIMASSTAQIEKQGFGTITSLSKSKNGVDYGLIHEFGGRHHPARPFLRPAWDWAKRQGIGRIVKGKLINILKTKAGRRLKVGKSR